MQMEIIAPAFDPHGGRFQRFAHCHIPFQRFPPGGHSPLSQIILAIPQTRRKRLFYLALLRLWRCLPLRVFTDFFQPQNKGTGR
jgi:hypothetical protein